MRDVFLPHQLTGLFARVALLLACVAAALGFACGDNSSPSPSVARPLPSPVAYRQNPDGVTLSDPAFEALSGAHADFGRLGGASYQIEMPDHWNGRLVLYMHGYEELALQAHVSPPGIRHYLVGQGYAWGASSFSSTNSIPGRAADETAALWDFFTQKYGRPSRTYVTGQSMGGNASHIAAERYPDRFDGALALCGAAGQAAGLKNQLDYFIAGAFVAGVTQQEFDNRNDLGLLIRNRIRPALEDPAAHEKFENIMIDLTGGPRAFDREGFLLEEDTNWRRSEAVVTIGIARNADTVYKLGALSDVTSDDFNRGVIRIEGNAGLIRTFTENDDLTGDLQIPLLSLHTTGDWQVPIEQAQILQQKVDAAGKSDLLVQRVMRDSNHCGFSTAEWEANLDSLVAWVEHGAKPEGEDVLVGDLRTLSGKFELTPRSGTPEGDAVTGARDRATFRGALTLDGAPLNARWLGAVVLRSDGLVTPCQATLPPVVHGQYEIAVLADSEVNGCGADGSQILFWTFAQNKQLFALGPVAWPGNGGAVTFDGSFSAFAPKGNAPPTTEFEGDVYDRDGRHMPAGTRIEAYVGEVRCGLTSVRRGTFSGYILSVVGPDSVPGCDDGATITFRINGGPAGESAVNGVDHGQGALDLTQQ